jgi:hypothetical protein
MVLPVLTLIQYYEFCPDYEKCKAWMEKNLPEEFERATLDDKNNGVGDNE